MERVASRFHPNSAVLAAALALEGPRHPIEAYTSWLYNLPRSVVDELPFDLSRYLVRIDDPSGKLRLDWLTELSMLFSAYKNSMSPEEVLEFYTSYVGASPPKLPKVTGSAADDVLHAKVLEIRMTLSENEKLSEVNRRRSFLRMISKANGIPDRTTDGSPAMIELWIRDEWVGVEVTPPGD